MRNSKNGFFDPDLRIGPLRTPSLLSATAGVMVIHGPGAIRGAQGPGAVFENNAEIIIHGPRAIRGTRKSVEDSRSGHQLFAQKN